MIQLTDRGRVGLLVLLDLSAAFDLLDHGLLLDTLTSRAGCSDKARAWLKSFLTGRRSRVCWGEGKAPLEEIWCGVPQGSCLSPSLFNIYLSPLFDLLDRIRVSFANFADDTQILLEMSGDYAADSALLETTYQIIKRWMSRHWMCLNSEKTELMIIAAKNDPIFNNNSYKAFKLEGNLIQVVRKVKTLGVFIDAKIDMDDQADHIINSCQYPLRLIRSARPFLSRTSNATIARALILTKLDYCNGLLGGIKKSTMNNLQILQNDAVRAATGTPRNEHISETRREFHWLPVAARVRFKLLCLAYKCANNSAPEYMRKLCQTRTPARAVRSLGQIRLQSPNFIRARIGGRSFPVRAAREWNALQAQIRKSPSFESFKRSLKTHLFY